MTHVYVSVRLHGAVVEQRLVPLRDGLRLGEHPEADVAFPGADLLLRITEEAVWVRGRQLGPGDDLFMALGPVSVQIEICLGDPPWTRVAQRIAAFLGGGLPMPDLRLLLATGAIAVAAAFADAATGFVQRNPAAHDNLQVLLETVAPEGTATARIQAPEGAGTDPVHPERDAVDTTVLRRPPAQFVELK